MMLRIIIFDLKNKIGSLLNSSVRETIFVISRFS